jgi:hypothetical protein
MQAEEIAVIVSIVSLIVSVIGSIWNYRRTNHLFEQSNYPKLIPELELSGGYNGTYVRLKMTNTHSSTSVSDVYIALEFSGKQRRLSFPKSFSVKATPIDNVDPKTSVRTAVKDEQNLHSLKNINDLILSIFPDLFVPAADKTIQSRQIEGTPGKEISTNEQYYMDAARSVTATFALDGDGTSQAPLLTAKNARGKPGSYFVFVAQGFVPNKPIDIAVNGHTVLTVIADSNGESTFALLFGLYAPPGSYTIGAATQAPTAARSAQTQVIVDASAALLPQPDDPTLPWANGTQTIFLPLVRTS